MGLDVFQKSRAGQGKFAGKVLAGRYYLDRNLGEGAEGVIYSAHSRYNPEEQFAVKVGYSAYREGEAEDGLPLDPILREHAVLRQLAGPFVPKPVQSGWSEAEYAFAVRELLPGMSLAKLLRRNPSPPLANCLLVGHALCSAMASVHNQGILHRDIKPGNIMIAPGFGQDISLRLIDFAAGCRTENEIPSDPEKTLGTPAYMAPERANGNPAGEEGDLYAVGAILYELFTNASILGPDSWSLETAHQILQSDLPIPAVPLRELRPDLPPEISRLIEQLVQREPEARTGSMEQLKDLLHAYLRRDQIDTTWFAPTQASSFARLPEEPEPWYARLIAWFRR